jgi:hypothetical protein
MVSKSRPNLNGKTIAFYGGMQKGLPLANPKQAGLLAQGTIYPAYANWQGTAMTLDMQIVNYLYAGLQNAVNIVLNWKANQPLATALQNALSTAFPQSIINIAISPNLVQNHDEPHKSSTMPEFAQYIQQKTQAMLGGDYSGVDIAMNGQVIQVSDGTVQTSPKQIAFQDMIGQPTWRELTTLQLQTVLRGDIGFSDFVTLPKTITALTAAAIVPPQANIPSRSNSSFEGTFWVERVRHVGRLRQPDAASWSSVYDLRLPPGTVAPPDVGPPITGLPPVETI